MSFDWSFLRAFHEIEPGQVLGALGPAVSLADGRRSSRFSRNCGRGWLDELEKTGAAIVIWSRRVSRDAIRLAHSRGLRVWVYTVDHPKLAVRLCGIGVDGIITNKIARIQHALGTC
jgi:glycerophosphoryl diester phosphodiesterase